MKRIRVGLEELEGVVPLFDAYRVFYGQTSDLAAARAFLRARIERAESVIFLARDEDGRARGFVQLYPTFSSVTLSSRWILNDLYVVPEARRTGVATALLARAREHAVDAGATGLSLATAEDNSTAQALYASRGWRRDGFLHYFLPV